MTMNSPTLRFDGFASFIGTSDLALAIPSRCRSSGISLSNTRLSPLIHDHINLLGRYSFAMPDIVARGGLLPLRDPTDQNA